MTSSEALLDVRGLQVHYGGIHAVRDLDLSIWPGEVVCLIGANGAGKTSTLKALARMLPASGQLRYAGTDLHRAAPHTLISQGLTLVPEGRGILARMSIADNLRMGAYGRHDDQVADDLAHLYVRLPRLYERRHQLAGTLSGGEQQMLAIGRALMGRPRLLLLDEPSMGLAPLMVKTIFGLIRSIAEQGVTILLVEQNARLALQVASRGYVMESGCITLSGASAMLLADRAVQRAYLGGCPPSL